MTNTTTKRARTRQTAEQRKATRLALQEGEPVKETTRQRA